MIERYTRKEVADIWSEDNKYAIWLEIELLACEAQVELGNFPADDIAEIRRLAKVETERINEIELTTKHDVIAFLTNVEEYIGDLSKYVHLGMTSSDVLDTCLSVQVQQSGKMIMSGLDNLIEILKSRAIEHKYTLCVGRSHGIHAEATTMGLKFALWYDEAIRCKTRLTNVLEDARLGMLSGAVGTYEHLPLEVENFVCEKLGLKPVNISTQVIQRDVFATVITAMAQVASLIEKIAIEVRHLQRTEVREAEEFFSKGQKGSSAMPHKRNPILSENVTGLARLIRSYVNPVLENNVLWHERDISHSSVERVIFPDAFIALDFILYRAGNMVKQLVIYPERMLENLDLTLGLIHSQKILLALAKKGLPRQDAYVMVQRNAMRTWDEKVPFKTNILADEEIAKYLSSDEIESLFNTEQIFKSTDKIFERLGLK